MILHLALGKRPKRDYLHAPGEELRDLGQQHDIRRSGEQKPSGLVPEVNNGFDHRKDFWNMLDLVECNRKRQASDETVAVAARTRRNSRVVKGRVLAAASRYPLRSDLRAFSGLPRTVDENGGGVLERLDKSTRSATRRSQPSGTSSCQGRASTLVSGCAIHGSRECRASRVSRFALCHHLSLSDDRRRLSERSSDDCGVLLFSI